ncbi:MAG: hypothetical protein R3F65_26635 [bacterium]
MPEGESGADLQPGEHGVVADTFASVRHMGVAAGDVQVVVDGELQRGADEVDRAAIGADIGRLPGDGLRAGGVDEAIVIPEVAIPDLQQQPVEEGRVELEVGVYALHVEAGDGAGVGVARRGGAAREVVDLAVALHEPDPARVGEAAALDLGAVAGEEIGRAELEAGAEADGGLADQGVATVGAEVFEEARHRRGEVEADRVEAADELDPGLGGDHVGGRVADQRVALHRRAVGVAAEVEERGDRRAELEHEAVDELQVEEREVDRGREVIAEVTGLVAEVDDAADAIVEREAEGQVEAQPLEAGAGLFVDRGEGAALGLQGLERLHEADAELERGPAVEAAEAQRGRTFGAVSGERGGGGGGEAEGGGEAGAGGAGDGSGWHPRCCVRARHG